MLICCETSCRLEGNYKNVVRRHNSVNRWSCCTVWTQNITGHIADTNPLIWTCVGHHYHLHVCFLSTIAFTSSPLLWHRTTNWICIILSEVLEVRGAAPKYYCVLSHFSTSSGYLRLLSILGSGLSLTSSHPLHPSPSTHHTKRVRVARRKEGIFLLRL